MIVGNVGRVGKVGQGRVEGLLGLDGIEEEGGGPQQCLHQEQPGRQLYPALSRRDGFGEQAERAGLQLSSLALRMASVSSSDIE